MTRPRRNARLSSITPPASETAIRDLEVRRLAERAAAAADPVADPAEQDRQWDFGLAEESAAQRGIAEKGQPAFLVDEPRRLPEDGAKPFRALARGDALATGDVQHGRRRRAELEAAQRVAVGISLPYGVERGDREVDRLPREHLPRDVDQRAVPEIHCVVEPEHQRAESRLARDVLHHALPSEAGLRILADRCR